MLAPALLRCVLVLRYEVHSSTTDICVQDKGGTEDTGDKPAAGGSGNEETVGGENDKEQEAAEPLELPPAEDTPTEGGCHEICRPVHSSSSSPYFPLLTNLSSNFCFNL